MAKLNQYGYIQEVNGISIPESWALSKVKYLGKYINGYAFKPSHWSDKGKPIIRIQNLTNQKADINKTNLIVPERYHITEGDILISWSATLDVYIWSQEDAWLNQHIYKVVVNNDKIINKYFFWSARWFMKELNEESHGSTMQHLTTDKFGSFPVPLPPIVEQRKIVNFLDYETAKIDTLIEKQQRLIELLTEKRQAVISHAVTKGLNPDVPMKDSGVEWLGEVPEHWEVSKFSHCAQIRNGLVSPRDLRYKQLVLYAPNHIEKATGKVIYKETAEEQGADSSKYLCFKGEVIYSKIRPALAKVALCEEVVALCSADMYPISALNGLTNEFLYYFMLSDNFTKAAILDSDRVAMPKINRESLSDYKVPIPSINEQKSICEYISTKINRFDIIEAKAKQAIQLMQERRTALISAAVTGKIDVRDWVRPE